MPPNVELRHELPSDYAAIDALYRAAFGPGRHTRTAYRIRGATPHDPAVSFVADRDGLVIGAIRQTRVSVGGDPAFLLGPLAVAETAAKQGLGRALLARSIAAAERTRAASIVLVGDLPFYGHAGFRPASERIRLPGPVEPHRLLERVIHHEVVGMVESNAWAD